MRIVDRKTFFDGYRKKFGRIRQDTVDALESLLRFLEADSAMSDIRWCAYAFATAKWETDSTFRPIEEYGKGKGMKYGVPAGPHGLIYYGRGLTQNTWYENYLMLTKAWNNSHSDRQVDFTLNPDLLLKMEYSYWAMSYAMRNGTYTGRKLSDFINSRICNYISARKIVNGMDHAQDIAQIAVAFELILTGEA